ncbi:MAG TPA: glycosyl hydrolase, partial [Gemmatimonadales bacterium]
MPRLRLLFCSLVLAAPARAQAPAAVDTSRFSALHWRLVGPFRGGRVDAVAGVVGQPLVYYFGATGGGVWKTVDGGLTWNPVADKTLTTGSIGALAVAESDPNVVYAGSGEETVRGNVSPGDGMYKSTDAGKTWSKTGLADAGQIGRIAVHPRNADLVYVAVIGHAFGPNAMRGLYRSADGGKTWQRILSRNDSTGAIDVVLDPTNPRVIYASLWQAQRTPWDFSSGGAGSGLFKSTDGGDTWTELTRNKGMPAGVIGRIDMAVSPVDPERVWAVVEAKDGGVFRSDDGGTTWTKTSDDHEIRQRAWYFSNIYADPASADVVYTLNTSLLKSVDGGATFKPLDAPHGDHHALWIDPTNPQRMINGNDGGATVTTNGGESWTTQDNQPTAQFYHVIATTHWPYKLCGAQQDNSTVCIASSTDGFGITDKDWFEAGGGESGWLASRADDPDVIYAGSYGNHITRLDTRTGQERNINAWPDNPMGHGAADLKYRFQWTFPIVLAPTNPNDLYIGAQVLFKSTDEGASWQLISPDLTRNDTTRQRPSGGPITKDNTSVEYYGTIFTVAPSPKDSNAIWVGTDDGLVQLTRDGGKTWQNVTPKEITAGTQVSTVEASPVDAATAYVAATRYKLDDFAPYAFVTHDFGKTWRKITAGIPATHFVRVVRQDPVRPELLYAGTEFGPYVSFNDGANWQPLRLNLPVTPVHDLTVKGDELAAATHGRAFWILGNLGVLRQLSGAAATADRVLYTPGNAWRTGGGGFGRAIPGVGENAPRGAQLAFYLKSKPDSAVTVAVLDARDSVVRTWSTRPADPQDSIEVKAGMNVVTWNLRYAGAHRFKGLVLWGGGTQGPVAVPGTYKVRVSTAGWSDTKTFQVVEDPRVHVTPADLQKQFDLLVRIRDRVS